MSGLTRMIRPTLAALSVALGIQKAAAGGAGFTLESIEGA